ncbi:MAG: class I SAM-dependent methyltransferase [Acidobacteriota bacterium]
MSEEQIHRTARRGHGSPGRPRRRHPVGAGLVALLALGVCPSGLAVAQDSVQHSFADVSRFVRIFDAPERDAWQKPAEVIKALDLEPGMRVADVGAGTGYFLERLSGAVGSTGAVFASDLEPGMIVHLRDRAESAGLDNVIPVLASVTDPRLPDGAVDVVLICDTWHHISSRVEYARRLRRDLAPGGRVVIVDFRPGDLPVGPPAGHGKISARDVSDTFTKAGYRLDASLDLLEYQYVLTFSPVR